MTLRRTRARWLGSMVALSLMAAACGDDSSDASSEAASPGGTPPSPANAGADNPFAELCPADEAPDELVLSIWNGHIETLEAQFEGFTTATGVDVEFLGNGTGDRVTRLNVEAGNPTIDVAVLPVNEVATLLDNGVIMPASEDVPNYGDLVDVAKVEGGYGTSVLQVAVGYNPEHVEAPESWTDIFTDEQYAGHISLVQIPDASGYGALAMVARELGGSEEDLTAAIDLIAEARDDILVFTNAASEAEPQVATGDVWIYPALAGTIVRYREEGGPVEIAIPGEGGPAGLNVAVIPDGVEHVGCAQAMVGWMLEPELQVAYASAQYFGPSVSDAEIPADMRDLLHPVDPASVVELDWAAITADAAENLDHWSRNVIG